MNQNIKLINSRYKSFQTWSTLPIYIKPKKKNKKKQFTPAMQTL